MYDLIYFLPLSHKVTHLSKKAHSKRLYYVRMIGNQKSVDIAIKPTLVCGQSSCRDRVIR